MGLRIWYNQNLAFPGQKPMYKKEAMLQFEESSSGYILGLKVNISVLRFNHNKQKIPENLFLKKCQNILISNKMGNLKPA